MTYKAGEAIDRDIERTEEMVAKLEAEIEERRQYLEALKRAKAVLDAPAVSVAA